MVKSLANALLGVVLIGLLSACGSSMPDKPLSPTAPIMVDAPEVVPVKEPPSRTGNPPSYRVFGKRYAVKATSEGYRQRGIASWYGRKFHGRKTSSGVRYNMYGMTAAHKTLPIPTYARVTHLGNGRSIVVKINDRGPFAKNRIIDLSYAAATKLDMVRRGTAFVEVVALPPYQYLSGVASGKSEQTLSLADSADRAVSPRLAHAMPVQPITPLFLQVGAFSERDNAKQLQTRLSGFLKHTVRIDSSTADLHKVQVGPLANPADAELLALQLNGLGIDASQVVFE